MKCEGIFGRLFGHNYQPVFERIPPTKIDGVEGRPGSVLELIRAMTQTVHVHTCCTRCGNVIEVEQP